LLAVTYARQGDPEQACDVANKAVDILAEDVDSDRCIGHVRRAQDALAPYRKLTVAVLPVPILRDVAAQWTMSDAWVFSSIDGTCLDDGYTLGQIIAKADGINHAVMTEDEFTRAVPRLVAAGLVGAQAEADRYWHTEAGQALYQRWMKRGGLFSWLDVVQPALRQLGEPQDATWSLPAGAFHRAVQEHLQWGEAILNRRRRYRRRDSEGTP
jgi:hypothetical protein